MKIQFRKIYAALICVALTISLLCERQQVKAAENPYDKPVNDSSTVDKAEVRILMIGNSLTFFNNSPRMLKNMIKLDEENGINDDKKIVVNYLTWSGQRLYNHANMIEDALKNGAKKQDEPKSKYEERLDFYKKVLYRDYHYSKGSKRTMQYDYIILQEKAPLLTLPLGSAYQSPQKVGAGSANYYNDSWLGGVCRVCYLLKKYGVATDDTKFILNATWSLFKDSKEVPMNLSQLNDQQKLIDNNAKAVKRVMTRQTGFKGADGKKYYIKTENMLIAYSGKAVLCWLNDKAPRRNGQGELVENPLYEGLCVMNTETNRKRCINPFILKDYKHPTQLGSMMEAATLYSTIYKRQACNYKGRASKVAFNLNTCRGVSKEKACLSLIAADSQKYKGGFSTKEIQKQIDKIYYYALKYGSTYRATY